MPSQTTKASWQLKSVPGTPPVTEAHGMSTPVSPDHTGALPLGSRNISLKSCFTVGASLGYPGNLELPHCAQRT